VPLDERAPNRPAANEPTSTVNHIAGSPSTALTALAIVAACFLAGSILWIAGDVLLLIFSGLLLATLLVNLSKFVESKTQFGYKWALAGVSGLLALVFCLVVALFAFRLAGEAEGLYQTVQSKWQEASAQLQQYQWVPTLDNDQPLTSIQDIQRGEWFSRIAGWFTSTFGIFSGFILILFIGIFTAVNPDLYRRGLLHLIPHGRRARVAEVFDETADKLWWWMLGQLMSMTAVGIAIGIGLWLLGIPFAATLGLLSGLLTFIPNFGPILSAIPAILLGFNEGILPALYVTLLYTGVQAAESNLLTPLVQQRNVKLPPVLNIGFQVLLGVLFGLPGLILAAPLAVVAMILTKRLYVEDCLGDQLGSDESDADSENNA
jgi:predicted PurR-regulated permease PerM